MRPLHIRQVGTLLFNSSHIYISLECRSLELTNLIECLTGLCADAKKQQDEIMRSLKRFQLNGWVYLGRPFTFRMETSFFFNNILVKQIWGGHILSFFKLCYTLFNKQFWIEFCEINIGVPLNLLIVNWWYALRLIKIMNY